MLRLNTLTASYLNGHHHIAVPTERRKGNGKFIDVTGVSGSGKSTLLNILGGLDVPTAGKVSYRDHNLTIDDDAELTRYRREHVGFVFQFYNLIPVLTPIETVELPLLLTNLSKRERRERAMTSMSA